MNSCFPKRFILTLWLVFDRETKEKHGRCSDPHLPPCAAYEAILVSFLPLYSHSRLVSHPLYRFVEIMATVFSRDAWRCAWHMIQVFSSLFLLSLSLHSFICNFERHYHQCRTTWFTDGVLILLFGDAWRYFVDNRTFSCCILILQFNFFRNSDPGGSRENWSRGFAMDRSPRDSYAW